MEALDKLEVIMEGTIKEKKREIERAMSSGIHPALQYVNGLQHEVYGLEKALSIVRGIKQDAPSLSASHA